MLVLQCRNILSSPVLHCKVTQMQVWYARKLVNYGI